MKPTLRDVPVQGDHGFYRLAYAEWGSRRAKRTVLCVHGLSRTGRDFDPLAQALAEAGMRVIAPDLPGRGRSDWLRGALAYSDEAYMRAMATLIARLDVAEVDWIGTSLGGHIGMLVAAQSQAPIHRLVLNDFGARVSATALRRIGSYFGRDWRFDTMDEAEAHLREVHAPFGALSDSQWRHLTETSIVEDEDGGLRFHFDPGIGARFRIPVWLDISLWHLWDAIECPVLLLRGEDSELISRSTVQRMAARNGGASAAGVLVHEIAGCGHAPALMDEEQIGLVRSFLLDADGGPIAIPTGPT